MIQKKMPRIYFATRLVKACPTNPKLLDIVFHPGLEAEASCWDASDTKQQAQ